MQRKLVPIALVVVVVVAAIAWKLHHHTSEPTNERAGSAAASRPTAPKPPPTPASLDGRVTRKAAGSAVAGAGSAVAGAVVAIVRGSSSSFGEDDEAPPIVVTTDAAGTWHADSVAPGKYFISATAAGLVPATIDVSVAAGEHRRDIALELAPGGIVLHGTVSELGGGPLTGVRIEASVHRMMSAADDGKLVAVTGRDGRYELTLAAGAYSIAAGHEDYTRDTKHVQLRDKPVVVDFQLVPGGSIAGKVVAADSRKPVAGALVMAQLGAGIRMSSASATSDGDGNFTLHGLRSGAVAITARARGYASGSPTTVQLGIGEQIPDVRVVVDHALAIRGHVVKKTDHHGIAGVHVGAYTMSGGAATAMDPTGDDGAFEISGVKPGSYMLFAAAEGLVPEMGKTVEVGQKDIDDLTVELEVGVTLAGRVEPAGVTQLSVELSGDFGLSRMMEAARLASVHGESDANGAFAVHNVPAGSFSLVARSADGSAGKLAVVVAATDQQGLVVHVEARGSISGRVVDSHGAPAVGTEVSARLTEKPQTISFNSTTQATTADDGSFHIVGLEPGKYRVSAESDMRMMIVQLDKDAKDGKAKDGAPEVELAAGEAKTGVVITLTAKDGVIRGNVVDQDGNAMPDAWVTAHWQPGDDSFAKYGAMFDFDDATPHLTGSDGKFVIDHLRDGAYTLVAEGPRGASRAEQKAVKTGDTPTLTLATLGTLTGHVTNAGTAVPTYDLRCLGAGSLDRSVSAPDGGYLVDNLPPGHYTCNVEADAGTGHGEIDIASGSAQLDFTLVGWASVTGTVVSVQNGKPVPGLIVLAVADSNMSPRNMIATLTGNGPTTDANGKFVVPQVAAGAGKVMVMAPDAMSPLGKQTYDVQAGQQVDVGVIKIVPPRLGDAGTFGLATSPDDQGLAVTSVAAGGPAALAGVVVGDHVTAIDGNSVTELTPPTAQQLIASGSIAVGAQVTLTLARGTSVALTAVKW